LSNSKGLTGSATLGQLLGGPRREDSTSGVRSCKKIPKLVRTAGFYSISKKELLRRVYLAALQPQSLGEGYSKRGAE
jgi:hypothetical protein